MLIAVADEAKKVIREYVENADIEEINSEDQFDEKFESLTDSQFTLICCGDSLGSGFTMEAAQIVNNQCPKTKSYFIGTIKEEYRPKEILKNGINSAFILPADKNFLKEQIEELLASLDPSKIIFKPVSVFDLTEDTTVGFDTYLYLPMNKKHIKYTKSGTSFGNDKLDKLKAKNVSSLFIDNKDMDKFYEYTAEQLANLDSLGETEKTQKLEGYVRNLFGDLFDQSQKVDFNFGKEKLNECKKIISTYITGSSNSDWYSSLIRAMKGSSGEYSHSSEVSTIAALIGMGLNYPNVEDLALAGFLHDISYMDLPECIEEKEVEDYNEEELKAYHEHPVASINIIKTKKMILTPEVEKAILQHHEKFNGTGFPKGLTGERITLEAQILSFADQFQYLTSFQDGKKKLSPVEAFNEIANNGSIGPELLAKVKKLFPTE